MYEWLKHTLTLTLTLTLILTPILTLILTLMYVSLSQNTLQLTGIRGIQDVTAIYDDVTVTYVYMM